MAERWKSGLHHPVSVYAKQVTQGKLREQCCRYEILACQRHLDDLRRQGTDEFPYIFDTTRADRIIRFFSRCIQVRGVEAGQPIQLQPWQVFDLGCTYGWVDRDTGARRFSRTYNKRGRGNCKSTEKSGQALYHMCADAMYPPYRPELAVFEAEPEVECAAVDRPQAMRVFGDAKKIALASPDLARRLIVPRSNPVTHRKRGGYMRALSKDTKNKDSGAPSYFVVDEYHAHPTSMTYDLGLNSFGKRPQALLDVITTAGDDAQSKPCYTEEAYAKHILDGDERDESYFVMIRELDEGNSPHDEAKWLKANPCLRYPNDYSRYLLKQIRDEHTAAYGSRDPGKIRAFLTRRMCLWQTGSVNRYLDEHCMVLARAAQVPPAEFAALTDGLHCHCGFDLGKRIDLSGVGSVFPLPDGRVAIKGHGFMPEGGAQRHEHTDRVPYTAWARGGHCTLTPGDVTDNSYVDNWICAGEREHGWKVDEVDYDGHNATDLAIKMCEERNNEDFCVEVAQNCAGQNLAVKGFRELLLQGKIVLEESPLLIWCLANAVEIQNNYGDIKLSKKHKDDTERMEHVAYWHQAHSFARGNWRRSDETSPMILAKSCHDMDILRWLAGEPCLRVQSFGSLDFFTAENAPAGAAERCLDGCRCKESCPYDAEKIYITDPRTGIRGRGAGWPCGVLVSEPDEEKIREALRTGPYGRCVFHCDNDVVDHQTVNLEFANHIHATFTMTAFTQNCHRTIKVTGTMGEVEGDMEKNVLHLRRFGKPEEMIDLREEGGAYSGHGGGDFGLMEQFCRLIAQGGANALTGVDASVESHVMALAAEASRLDGGRTITLSEF